MNRILIVLGLAVTSLLPSQAHAEPPNKKTEAVTIPLDQIWAYNMPGTRDVRDLEPKLDLNSFVDEHALHRELARRSDVWRILNVLGERPKKGEKAGPAFVVVGTGKEALRNARAVLLAKHTERRSILPPDTDLSLVFYSYESGPYVRLVNVQQSPGEIKVEYQLVRHRTQISSRHFALIPLGELPEGEVPVKVAQAPTIYEGGKPAPPVRDPLEFISGSFSFGVREQ